MRICQQVLAVLAIVYTIFISIWIWHDLYVLYPPGDFNIWPLPALYLLELIALTLVVLAISGLDLPTLTAALWIIPGMVLAFIVLGAITIGPAYVPTFLLLFLISILAEIRHRGRVWLHLASGLGGVVFQTGLIALMLWLSGALFGR